MCTHIIAFLKLQRVNSPKPMVGPRPFNLAGIELVLSRLSALSFTSLIDVGCGDGRFLRQVKNRFGDVDLLGVDYFPSTINLARALNPEIDYNPLIYYVHYLRKGMMLSLCWRV